MLFAAGTTFSTGGPMTPNQQTQFGSTTNDMREYAGEQADETLQSAKRQLNDVLDGITDRARDCGRRRALLTCAHAPAVARCRASPEAETGRGQCVASLQ